MGSSGISWNPAGTSGAILLPESSAPAPLRRPTSYVCRDFSATHSSIECPIARHLHREYILGYHFVGRSECLLPGRKPVEFAPGDVGFLRPGTVHEDRLLSRRLEYLVLRIEPCYLESLLSLAGCPDEALAARCWRTSGDARFGAQFAALRDELIRKDAGYEIVVRSLVNQVLVHLFRHMLLGSDTMEAPERLHGDLPWQVRRALQYLQHNYKEGFDLDRTAAAVGISKYYLVRLFRSSTGLTLNTYLLQLRVEKAKQMLAGSGRSISEVAMDLGFSDQSHLARVFKRFTGLTPLAYRQGAR